MPRYLSTRHAVSRLTVHSVDDANTTQVPGSYVVKITTAAGASDTAATIYYFLRAVEIGPWSRGSLDIMVSARTYATSSFCLHSLVGIIIIIIRGAVRCNAAPPPKKNKC